MAIQIKKVSKPNETPIFKFGVKTDGNGSMKDVLGGKGANLAEMSSIGLPVPPGFTIPCACSIKYLTTDSVVLKSSFLKSLWESVGRGTKYLESCFGYMPLMSVRSGSRVSMPGMMDTILNVGLCEATLPFWKEKLGARAALDSYRRLIQMYSSVAMEVPLEKFEHILKGVREEVGVKTDSELSEDDLSRVISRYRKMLHESAKSFPDDPWEQLTGAILSVFKSWNNERAQEYRKINGYPDDWGTAVTVQSMVFGNMNDASATGVVFTRCPSTGTNKLTGEFLVNAQGEDVVAGIRTPEPMTKLGDWNFEVSEDLATILKDLEAHYKDMQDVEFTVQDGKLYILQTRNGKRSPAAAFRIAHDMAQEGVITKADAIKRVTPSQLLSVMQDVIDPAFDKKPVLTGFAAGGSVVTGKAMFSSASAINCKGACILVREETDPDDIAGMNASVGILTATGGLTSHAAVVARGMNKTCVVGCTDLDIQSGILAGVKGGPMLFNEGDIITIDGSTGSVWVGAVPVVAGGNNAYVQELLSWAADSNITERLELDHKITAEGIDKAVGNVTSKSMYIDTAMLEMGYDAGLAGRMSALGESLASWDGVDVYVDLRPIISHYEPVDLFQAHMFGVNPESNADALLMRKVEAILKWPSVVREKTVVRLTTYHALITGLLAEGGVRIMGKVSTVQDLLHSSGPIEVSESVIASVFGSKEAFNEIKELVEAKKGVSLSGAVSEPLYWYNFLNKAA